MDSGDLHLIMLQNLCDLVWSISFDGQPEDPADHFGSFLVHDPVVTVMLILEITIGAGTGNVFAGVALGLKYGLDLLGRVPRVPLVHDITERSEVIVTLESVHAVIDSNQTDPFLPEHLHDLTDLQIITAHTAHVLNANCSDVSFVDLIHHGHKARTVEAGAGDPIVCEMHWTRQVVCLCIVHKHLFLIADTV